MKNNKGILVSLLIVFFAASSLINCKQKTETETDRNTADIVIYGGTSAAVTAAVEAKRSGKSERSATAKGAGAGIKHRFAPI